MSINTFKRGLSEKLLELLAAERNNNGWWQSVVEDKDLVVAIRDNYLNIYHNGNSLMKLSENRGKLVCEVHYKYLLSPTENKPYIKFEDSKATNFDSSIRANLFTNELTKNSIADLKKAAKVYSGEEKEGVHKIISSNDNIIDTEIAFSLQDEGSEKTKALRIDFAALRVSANGESEIVFYEVKHYSNKELFSGSGNPSVIAQIETYEQEYIEKNKPQIISAYSQGVEDLQRITGKTFGAIPTTINPKVRLVIFGFDQDQKLGANFKNRIDLLKDKLGSENVLLKGDAKDFRSGISN